MINKKKQMHFINLHITSNFVLSDRAHVGGVIRRHLGHVHLLTVQSVYEDACLIMELGLRIRMNMLLMSVKLRSNQW